MARRAQSDDTPTLAPVQPNEKVQTTNVEVWRRKPSRPARFTEATLLSAMEGAGKLVEDEELREAMREKGLGTPATRASIIEGTDLREIRFAAGTRAATDGQGVFAHHAAARAADSPSYPRRKLTGDWEFKLRSMARGQMKRADFMHEIGDMTPRDRGEGQGA
jgi:DNA topoisomerase-3